MMTPARGESRCKTAIARVSHNLQLAEAAVGSSCAASRGCTRSLQHSTKGETPARPPPPLRRTQPQVHDAARRGLQPEAVAGRGDDLLAAQPRRATDKERGYALKGGALRQLAGERGWPWLLSAAVGSLTSTGLLCSEENRQQAVSGDSRQTASCAAQCACVCCLRTSGSQVGQSRSNMPGDVGTWQKP